MSDSKVRKITTAALSASQVELSVHNFISLLSRTEKDLMISSLLGKQYEGSDWDGTFSQGTSVSSILNFRYRFRRSGPTSKPLASNMPMSFFYCCTVHFDICRIHSPTNALFNLKNIKIYIKIHKNIAPICFGLRPSSGSLHWTWLKLCLC